MIWIVGASSGIGAALANIWGEQGLALAVSGRSANALGQLAARAPDRIFAYPLDVADRDAVEAAAKRIEAERGPIRVLLFAAAAPSQKPHEALGEAQFRAKVEVNFLGAVRCVEAVLPMMRARNGGHIALIASPAGYRGLPRGAAYGALKAALSHYGESLRIMLAKDGIKVQLIQPGFVDTRITRANDFKMPFLLDVDDAARRIDRGLRGSGFEIAFPRRLLWPMKLLRVLPYWLYFPLIRLIERKRL